MKTTTTPDNKIATYHLVLQGFGALGLGQKFSLRQKNWRRTVTRGLRLEFIYQARAKYP
jgi:hypothetical protein